MKGKLPNTVDEAIAQLPLHRDSHLLNPDFACNRVLEEEIKFFPRFENRVVHPPGTLLKRWERNLRVSVGRSPHLWLTAILALAGGVAPLIGYYQRRDTDPFMTTHRLPSVEELHSRIAAAESRADSKAIKQSTEQHGNA